MEWELQVVRKFQQKEAGPNTWTTAFKNRKECDLEEYTCFCYKDSPGEGGVHSEGPDIY